MKKLTESFNDITERSEEFFIKGLEENTSNLIEVNCCGGYEDEILIPLIDAIKCNKVTLEPEYIPESLEVKFTYIPETEHNFNRKDVNQLAYAVAVKGYSPNDEELKSLEVVYSQVKDKYIVNRSLIRCTAMKNADIKLMHYLSRIDTVEEEYEYCIEAKFIYLWNKVARYYSKSISHDWLFNDIKKCLKPNRYKDLINGITLFDSNKIEIKLALSERKTSSNSYILTLRDKIKNKFYSTKLSDAEVTFQFKV